jgi:hypothetical protein
VPKHGVVALAECLRADLAPRVTYRCCARLRPHRIVDSTQTWPRRFAGAIAIRSSAGVAVSHATVWLSNSISTRTVTS